MLKQKLMNIIRIINELKERFNLKKNHVSILKVLIDDDLPADDIAEKTNISMGRIYNLLNELIEKKLIDKVGGTPAIYSIKNIEKNIVRFLDKDFQNYISKQNTIISLIEEKTRLEEVKILNNRKEYDFETIAFYSKGKWFKLIHRHLSLAWLLLPRDDEEFWRIRLLINKKRKAQTSLNKEIALIKHKSYIEACKNKSVEHIMTLGALKEYMVLIEEEFGKNKLKEWAKDCLNRIDTSKNVKIYIIDNPYSLFTIYVSNNEVISALLNHNDVSGVKILGDRISNIYADGFEEMKSKSKPIQEYLKEYE